MKKVKSNSENCIPVLTSCVEWNGGSIEYLGICDGDSLNNLLWEVITKLQEIAGEDLSQFDIDSLLEICNLKAPLEVDLLSILNILKDNQICLKAFIDELNEQLAELFKEQGVNVNMKCYAEFDNLGNALGMTRETLDQFIVDRLCDHKQRIETLEGKIVALQQQVDDIDPTATVEELSYDTCLDPGVDKPTSTNVVNVAQELCDLQDATGTPADISNAMSNFPTTDIPTDVTLNPEWFASPANEAEMISNQNLIIQNLLTRLAAIETGCCAVTCDDIELGFEAVYNEDGDGILINFTWGAGTSVPAGFSDCGSQGVITDVDGNTSTFNIDILDGQAEINITGLNVLQPLEVNITVRLCNGSVTCQKCVTKRVTSAQCQYCTLTVGGSTGEAIIIFTTPDVALD